MTTEQLLVGLAGFALGLAAGGCYLWLLDRSLRKLAEAESPKAVLLSAPLRIAVPVLVLVLVARWDHSALLGAVVGVVLVQLGARLFMRRPAPEAKP
jgi:hypothetical protein